MYIHNKQNKLKYENMKICLIYLMIGFLWIFFSDGTVNKLANDSNIFLIIGTYKGWLFVIVTSTILYLLINNFLKKVDLTEKKLNESYEELSAVNEELEAYVQQLTASEQELKIQYYQITESEEKYKALVSEMQQGLAIYQAIVDENEEIIEYRFLYGNKGHEKITGLKNQDILGKSISKIFPSIENSIIEKYGHVVKTGEPLSYENYLQELCKYFAVTVYRPQQLQIAVIVTDISERKQMEDKMEYLSYHDQLTGLYNRRFFIEELIRLDVEGNLPLTIIMGDINGLKLVNDSFGHVIGDELIKKVVEIMSKGCRNNDIISRIGGDEFVILLPKTDIYEAEKIVKRIKALSLKENLSSVEISISFGYETKKNEEEDIQDIFKKAEDNMYKKKLLESPSMRLKTINSIMATLNRKNKKEEQHNNRVSRLCQSIGTAMGLSKGEIKQLEISGLLHDIGKIAIDENILNKPGKLTDEEWEEVKRHSEIGYRILSTLNDMSETAKYVLAHHEKWDGTGYPKGLKGKEIPIQSRIIAIADSYEAMSSERNYCNALSEKDAIEELKKNAGIQFDPEIVRIFIEEVLNRPFY